jgi:protocatechuate 3,4-dioxygenase alpha subunit
MAMRDAKVEICQADAAGLFAGQEGADPNFTGLGQSPGDAKTGAFRFETVKSGRVAWPDGRLQVPHITVLIVARGINVGLHTRLYLADEADTNAEDPILSRIGHRDRVPMLPAQPEGDGTAFTCICRARRKQSSSKSEVTL